MARDAYRRLWEVLSGQERSERYARLTEDDRQAILEILRETKRDLPAYFTAFQSAARHSTISHSP